MHEIRHLTFSSRTTPKGITDRCNRIARECSDSGGDLYNGIRFNDKVLANYETARQWINENDNGWYNNLAVKYKDGRKTNWLVKIEYHC